MSFNSNNIIYCMALTIPTLRFKSLMENVFVTLHDNVSASCTCGQMNVKHNPTDLFCTSDSPSGNEFLAKL